MMITPPAHCYCHALTRDCPVDCLRTVLGTAAFHFLAGATLAWLAVTLWRTNGRPAPHSRPVRGKARVAAD